MKKISLYQGKVKAYKAVTKNRVQVELYDLPGIFEIFINQSWVVSQNDRLAIAGYRDETGKHCCYAYSNINKEVNGWKNKQSTLGPYFFILFSVFFIFIGLTKFLPHFFFGLLFFILGLYLLISTKRQNKIFNKSRKLIETLSN